MDLNVTVIFLGIAIFFARIIDVSLGTLRIINIVQGRTWVVFWLGFGEIIVWIFVVSTVIHRLTTEPILGVFYAFGFATGNVVGIKIEKWLAFGHIILRVISREHYEEMTNILRKGGYVVTIFNGVGLHGPVRELYIVCRRKDQKNILKMVLNIEPDAFYITEQAGSVSKIYRPLLQSTEGWRAIMKKK